ncbi:MAG TPA: hypothetical protein PKY58_00665 [Syntrophales bacterium]|nr:hypothetical protein [Syntrophales bacterium]HQB29136.1 hypothetical protein [Syntrophales bacterium]HQN77123.1 hypothetical protein [Syntrophales bacterium]HQQ26009.1 hypothetical protein [Syntrophales bacterium]
MKTNAGRKWMRILAVLCAWVLAGCAATQLHDYGKFVPDRAVTEQFERFRVDPGLVYYISGSDDLPNAIVGISREFTLQSELWKKRDFDEETLKDLVEMMQHRVLATLLSLQGFRLEDPSGKQVGVWFSIQQAVTSVRVEGDRVTLVTPPSNTYERFETRTSGPRAF